MVRRIEDLGGRLAKAEGEATIEPDGAFVLRGHLKDRALQACAAKTVQRLQEQRAAETATTMGRHDAEVLDRAGAVAIRPALACTAAFRPLPHHPTRPPAQS